MSVPPFQRPTPEQVQQLRARAVPVISAMFSARGVSERQARELVREAVELLLRQWHGVGDPATWLVAALDKATRLDDTSFDDECLLYEEGPLHLPILE